MDEKSPRRTIADSESPSTPNILPLHPEILPLPNYTLSSVCPNCGNDTYKLACKVRCAKCGFMWDCSEL